MRGAALNVLLAVAGLVGAFAPERVGAAGTAPSDWRRLDPDNTLIIETTEGRVVVEMRPDLAPLAVERIKQLSRERVYDGLLFHRVIDKFVDQTGNPNNRDGGVSSHPDLEPEFDAMIPAEAVAPAARPAGAVIGFLGSLPVEVSIHESDGLSRTWGLYCQGVAGMGRQAAWGSANSEIFFMRDPARRLDHDYTAWGRAVIGLDVLRRIKVGVPPRDPDRMISVRVAADLPKAQQPAFLILDERGAAFAALVAQARRRGGAGFTPCDIEIPAREEQ